MKTKPNKVVYTTLNHIGQQIAVVFQYGSDNSKTGDGVQIACIPFEWILQGKQAMNKDSAVCFDCPHSKSNNATCYVRKGMSNYGLTSKVNSLHSAYLNGTLDCLPVDQIETIEVPKLVGKFVRFGQYGEPVLLGERAVNSIAQVASNFTGYTHLWHLPKYAWAARYFMSSVETAALATKAQSKGFRTFRVRSKQSEKQANEVICPASLEGGRKVTCATCGLCKGNSIGAKSVTIIQH